jgi:hypothetical protein
MAAIFSFLRLVAAVAAGFIDDNNVTSFIDDNAVTSFVDDNGVVG